ncbi:MAG: cysteine synthase A [Pseudomonadota bacterium]
MTEDAGAPSVRRNPDLTGSSGRIHESLLSTIGETPLVRMRRLSSAMDCPADLLGKCEFFNPLSSVKDRIGIAMIEAAEADGRLQPNSVIVEPTSGNTGIALAFVTAAKGYRLILTMPESMSIERRKMLKLLGAESVLTPASNGMSGAIAKAMEIIDETPHALMLQQFDNPANPAVHRSTTAEEIWRDTEGQIDILVSGVGTGGTITGAGSVLKSRNPNIRIVAVEPEDSPVLTGGKPGPHKIQGIGAGFIPNNLDRNVIDEVLRIGNETAFATARLAARHEGMAVGISSGAALAAAVELGQRSENKEAMIVAILPSFAERYLSTPLFED